MPPSRWMVAGKDVSPESREIKIGSWIPSTPAKINLVNQQLICDNEQKNYVLEENGSKMKRLPDANHARPQNSSGSVGIVGTQIVPACYDWGNAMSVGGVESAWQEGVAANSHLRREDSTCFTFNCCQQGNINYSSFQREALPNSGDFSMNDEDKWTLSFGSLLALAQASGTAAAVNGMKQTGFIGKSSSSPSQNHLMGDVESLFPAEVEAELNSVPDSLRAGTATPSRILFDLNSSPAMIRSASYIDSMPSIFDPKTPDKISKGEHKKESSKSHINIDEMPSEEDARGVETVIELKEHHEKDGPCKFIIDQLYAPTSTRLLENHRPDEGGNETVDLIKTPRQKPMRKKHRPKVQVEGQSKSTPKRRLMQRESDATPINTTLRADINGTDSRTVTDINGTGSRTVIPISVGKRKYERKKGTDKFEPKLKKVTSKTRSLKYIQQTRSSCRRYLNFDLESPVRDVSSPCFASLNSDMELEAANLTAKNKPRETPQLGQEMEVLCHGTFDKEAINEQEELGPDDHGTPLNPSDCDHSRTCLIQGREVVGLRRRDKDSIGTAEMHFPEIYKKKRTEMGRNRIISNLKFATESDFHMKLERQQLADSCKKLFTSRTKQRFSVSKHRPTYLPNYYSARHKTKNKQKNFHGLVILGPTKWIKKKRSTGSIRMRNLSSLIDVCKELPVSFYKKARGSRINHNIKIREKQGPCMDALVADIRPTMTTKKRSERGIIINATGKSLCLRHKFFCESLGLHLGITWKRKLPIDLVCRKLEQLQLNAKSNLVSVQKQDFFFTCHTQHEERNAIIPYERAGAVVPYSLLDPVRSKQIRPKVDLDDETTRVWKLLLENINSEGIDGTDDGKRKWWEEERRVFNGRADSFIARMRLIQGDRRFSPWKGSVVDSVVGVFLTQNVSDHLSSSAFMSLAAYFPFKSKADVAELYDERLGTIVKEPEVYNHEDPAKLDKESFNRQKVNSKIFQDFNCNDIRMISMHKSSENKFDGIISKVDSKCLLSKICIQDPVVSGNSVSIKSNSSINKQRDADDTLSSQSSAISSDNVIDSSTELSIKRTNARVGSTSEEEPTAESKLNRFSSSTSFVKLLEKAETVLHGTSDTKSDNKMPEANSQEVSERFIHSFQDEHHFASLVNHYTSDSNLTMFMEEARGAPNCFELCQNNIIPDTSHGKVHLVAEVSTLSQESALQTTFDHSSSNHQFDGNQITVKTTGKVPEHSIIQKNSSEIQSSSNITTSPQNMMNDTGKSINFHHSKMSKRQGLNPSVNDPDYHPAKPINRRRQKERRIGKDEQHQIDWDRLRNEAQERGEIKEEKANKLDSVDWDAVRCAEANEIAQIIKERGMNNMLAQRIKDFLNRLVSDHGSTDLEWLRSIPPDKAKEYLLSIRGLGLKSVECVRLLTLHQLAFPVDTNVGRIAVRLGWVPLQPLPESLQLHLLELYPVLESIQKYLWPRLCKLDQRTLYELHYQMITFGKVFCTKNKPNCNACPMRGECRHFASAFASARLALPKPEERSIVSTTESNAEDQNSRKSMNILPLPSPEENKTDSRLISNFLPIIEEPTTPEPIIDMPATPDPDYTQVPEYDIENSFCDDCDEIPTIKLNMEEFTQNLHNIIQQNTKLVKKDMSKALVVLNSEAASIPVPKLKNVSGLRTEHQVYELPDSHPLLKGMDKREPDDPCPYLLAIWTPGETLNSTEPPERRCSNPQNSKKLCSDETCLSCNSTRESNSQIVRGTLLIPCRTAMRGSFPLNGTYFQVNEVFSDHESSLNPMDVPREWLWNMPKRIVYFGTSIPTIFKGLSTEAIQYCFWRGFVCVRGFDRGTRAPRPLIARLHFPVSKLVRGKGKKDEN